MEPDACSDVYFEFNLPTKPVNNDFYWKLQNSVNNILRCEKFITCKGSIKSISTCGGNYLGDLYLIDVNGRTDDGDKTLSIFVKRIIEINTVEWLTPSDLFVAEAFVYNDLFKLFAKMQLEAGVPENERCNMTKSFAETNKDVILLDNLTKKGYATLFRMDAVPLKVAELAVEQLARFHGLSFAMETKNPEYFNKKLKPMTYPLKFDKDWSTYVQNITDLVTKRSGNEKLKKFTDNSVTDKLINYFAYNSDSKTIRALCHGDYRANNMLVKQLNGEAVHLIPVDYQLVHYGCPVMDFIYFIYTATDRTLRREHLCHLKDLYFDTLRSFLNYFGINVESVYPRAEFDRTFKERLTYGLIMFLLLAPFLFNVEGDVIDLANTGLSDATLNVSPRFDPRLMEMLDEFSELGYL